MTLKTQLKIITWTISLSAFAVCATYGVMSFIEGSADYWDEIAIALVSFVAVWGIYWILCWFVLIVHRICKINNRQKQIMVLWLGIFIFVLMGLFPPVDGRYNNFEFLFNASSKAIAFGKLFVMWFIVAAITGGLLYALKDKNGKRKNDEP